MARLAALLVAANLATASAVSLPSLPASVAFAGAAHERADWWTRVGDTVYYAPPVSMLELGSKVSDYYYALGSQGALNDELRQHRVGGEGRWHIFHLPGGPSMLQTPRSQGDRRSSLSSLLQLEHGKVLEAAFPPYAAPQTYQYPGTAEAKAAETAAVASITADIFHKYLSGLTSLSTRSWDNSTAAGASESFLMSKLSELGLKSCLHNFSYGGRSLSNVVAVVPGGAGAQSQGTVTVGAHYDSRPFTGAAPGAEDNGSGVAALLATIKAFQEAGLKPKKKTFFAFFTAEEAGLYGSQAFAEDLAKGSADFCLPPAQSSFLYAKKQKTKVHASAHSAIVLDEVGWKSPSLARATANLESYDWTSAQVMDHLAQANADHNGVENLNVVHSDNPFGSDHMSFLHQGMSGVLVINGDDEAYPNYHKLTDTIENVNMEYGAQMAKMVFGGMVRVAGLRS